MTSTRSATAARKRAATYCRISSDDERRGLGVARQAADTAALAAREGLEVVATFVDNDRSASKRKRKDREQFADLMSMAKNNQIDAIVCHKLDRFSRMPLELEQLIVVAEQGITIYSANGHMDLSTRAGLLNARIQMAMAADEVEAMSERKIDQLRHDAEDGRPHWPQRPFGYNRDATLNEPEAIWVRQMYDWLIDDGLSLTQIAVRLHEGGCTTVLGKRWASGAVKLLLRNKRNAGRREYNGVDIGKASWPAIITPKRYGQAVTAIALRSFGTTSGRRGEFTGIVKCGRCDATMRYIEVGNYHAFKCHVKTDVGTGCGMSILADEMIISIRDQAITKLRDIASEPARVRSTSGELSELEEVEDQLDAIAILRGSGDMTEREWKTMRAPLVARRKALTASLARADAAVAVARINVDAGDVETLGERWTSLDPDLQRRLIMTVLSSVKIAPRTEGLSYWDRIALHWL